MQKRGSSSAASAPAAALVRGSDADGTKYTTAEELWQQERSKGLQQSWYGAAISYWSSVPATVDGVLGGYGRVSPLDLTESASFLDALAAQGCSTMPGSADSRAVDCGAGVGRITGGLLMQRFARVDVVEPVEHFLAQARVDLAQRGHVGEFHLVGLEAFDAPRNTYDCVWVQWVIGHLVDDHMVDFLQVSARRGPHPPPPHARAALPRHAQAARRHLREGESQPRRLHRRPSGQQPHAQRRALQAGVRPCRLHAAAGAAAEELPEGAVQSENVRAEVMAMNWMCLLS
jgi:SAM-dependent methyltransferase